MVNIFFLDKDPSKCAKYYCDKHVNKIMIEICQILSQIHYLEIGNKAPYKYTTTISNNLAPFRWASTSTGNYKYCINLAESLLDEYKYRYNKNTHKSERVIIWLKNNIPKNIKVGKRTKFMFTNNVNIYIDYYKDQVIASRNIYIDFKCKSDKWTKREIPEWYLEMSKNNYKRKEELKKKINNQVRVVLPNQYKNNKNIKVKRYHSFLRICYDTLFKNKWSREIIKYKNMYNKSKPLLHQLGVPQLEKVYKTSKELINSKKLQKLNNISLKYRIDE